jgi:hypothetical protein
MGRSQEKSVSLVTVYRLHDWEIVINFLAEAEIYLFSTTSRLALEPAQPLLQWIPGALSLEVKQPGHEADYSVPSSPKLELYLHSPIRSHGMVLI